MAETRTVTTNLKGRNDVFHVLALAEATQMPILLKASPGVGKTNAVLDYERAKIGDDTGEQAKENSFILEVDEGTRTSAVKGRPNMEELTVNGRYVVDSPIVDADVILINEIDKAGAELRNALLSIMNERKIYEGSNSKNCDWSLFCGTCNEIPKDEKGNPFWDRFVLKYELERLQKDQLSRQLKKGINEPKNIELTIPSAEDIEQTKIAADKLEKFVKVCYDQLTDRTLSYVPTLVKAAKWIYNERESGAFIKIAEILTSKETARQLSKEIEPKEVTDLRSRIEQIPQINSTDQLKQESKHIHDELQRMQGLDHVDNALVEELREESKSSLQNNALFQSSSSKEAMESEGHVVPEDQDF